METLIDIAFAPVNFVLSMLAILFVLYWLIVIFTGIDLNFADADADVHLPEKHFDFNKPDSHIGESAWSGLLKFFHIGELPIMFLLSFIVIFMWLIMVNATYYLGWTHSWMGAVLYFPAFALSLFITKFVSVPFVKMYNHINHKGEAPINFIGKTGRVIALVTPDKIGQIEVVHQGDVIRVNVMSADDTAHGYDEQVTITGQSSDQKYYLVASFH